jgi:hypothetical protein
MDFATIIKTIGAITAQAEAVAAQFEAAKDVLTSDQVAEVQGHLDRLQAANDALHERVTNKLRDAAQR